VSFFKFYFLIFGVFVCASVLIFIFFYIIYFWLFELVKKKKNCKCGLTPLSKNVMSGQVLVRKVLGLKRSM